MKKSKSEAGKIGGEKSKYFSALRKQRNIVEYLKNPKQCEHCLQTLPYEGRFKKFCNSSCSASYNNLKRTNVKDVKCKNCNKALDMSRKKFCDHDCQQNYQYRQSILNWDKKFPGKTRVKRYLAEKFGNCCSICGITDWNHRPIVFELEHKDGNSENNREENLCLICPNCHSQTDTYKNKNKGNGRHSRRLRYQQGKSY